MALTPGFSLPSTSQRPVILFLQPKDGSSQGQSRETPSDALPLESNYAGSGFSSLHTVSDPLGASAAGNCARVSRNPEPEDSSSLTCRLAKHLKAHVLCTHWYM